MAFVRNAWYVAAWERGLAPETLLPRTVLGENVVLFRDEGGRPGALLDRCPHRLLPLSKGRLKRGAVECGYHGLSFDRAGQCVRAPTQGRVPASACVRSFPVVGNMGMVWIWMGEPARAEATKVFDLPQYHDAKWGVAHGDALTIGCNYLLLCDNLCDPTHVNYVHPTTLGDPEIPDAPVGFEERAWGVVTTRWTLDSKPIGFLKAMGEFDDGTRVDRWQIYNMHLPTTSIIDFGGALAGTGAREGGGARRMQLYSCHFMTPVTERHTIDYWLHVGNFAPDDAVVGDRISAQFRVAFAEDKVVLEAIQIEEQRAQGMRGRIGLDLDASAGLFRRLIRNLIRDEQAATQSSISQERVS
jgi:vanillate O-demethylase monooxygenase subunit